MRGAFATGTQPGATSPLLVLLPSLGTTTALWDGVVAALRGDPRLASARILRIDLPGHGASPATRDPFTIGDLADAVLAVVDEAGGGTFHVAGVSLGGAVALELAIVHADRVRSLTVACSGARIGTPDGWRERAAAVRAAGTASLVTGSASRWFAPGFLEREGGGPGARSLTTLIDVDDESYARCAEALAEFDRTADLPHLTAPTLAIGGEHDAVTTPVSMQAFADRIPEARQIAIAGTSHLAVLEAPTTAADLIAAHVADVERANQAAGASERGMRVRREVLGDAHVDRAVAATTPETAAFQDFITRTAWGDVWARPALSRRERSIATLASLTTGRHGHELAMHVRAAQRNGLTRDEIAEVLLHTALYAGLPAANAAFAIARDVFGEASGEASDQRATGPGAGASDDTEENHG
ncbi:alpha/beta fold hydrolase [Agromyces sp. CFH 90414]|uniref:Alpha/beta fold hydrolase n=1 Tax=Agromyces agglutinans TaxID=2662258 RepID=A0A6I2EYW1_9MICO|nr:alpha/beta fold hydrolase [Agromyces agglutinans]